MSGSTGQTLGYIVGAIVGYFIPGGNVLVGAAIGSAVGGLLDPPKGPTIVGPRLSDLSVQTSTYGANLPHIHGTVATMGNVFWLEGDQIKETPHKKKSGGKGGGGSTQKTWTYSAAFAVGLCSTKVTGPIAGIRRIWVQGNLFYDAGSDDIESIMASNNAAETFALYRGTEDQMPDPRMQADKGVANTPAYRGRAYVVFYDLQLAEYGNSLMGAQVKVEVVSDGDFSAPPAIISNVLVRHTTYRYTSSALYMGDDGLLNIFSGGVFNSGGAFDPETEATATWGHFVATGVESSLGVPFLGPNMHLDGWADTPVCATPVVDGIHVYGITGTIAFSASIPGLATNDENVSYYQREETKFAVVEGSGVTTVYDIASGVGSAVHVSSSASSRGQVHDIFPGQDLIFAYTHDRQLTAYDYGWVEQWNVDLSSHVITTSGVVGGTDAVVREAEPGVAMLKWSGKFWRVTSAGYDFLGEVSGYPGSYEEHGGHHFIGGLWVDYNQDEGRVVVTSFSGYAQNPTSLGAIVLAEATQSGALSAFDLDVTELTAVVRGYRVTQTGAIRAAIEPLQGAWPFDLIQSGYKIKAVNRGGAPGPTIDAAMLDARPAGDAPGPQITIVREMDTQLPRRVTIKHLDLARDYDNGEQYAERLSDDSIDVKDLDMPIVLTAAEAAQKAEVLLYLYWLERHTIQFKLPPEYLALEPADVITITAPAASYELRLTSINYLSDGRLECVAKYNSAAVYTPAALGEEGLAPPGTIGLAGPTAYALMDLPALSSSMDEPLFIAAMTGYSSAWPGGILIRSSDGGQTWADLQGWSNKCTMGSARNAIGAHVGNVVDAASVLQVSLITGELESITELAMLNGGNHFAYGADGRWEIIAARTCTLQGDGSYLLQDMLRGRAGTEWATELHAPGDTVVLLNDPDLALIGMETASIGLSRLYRTITAGRSIDSDIDRAFTYRAVNLECLSPVYLKGSRHPTTDEWTLSWIRRTRIGGEWRDLVDATLSEASEAYEVDIFSSGAFTTVVRTLTSATPTASYTSAQQVEDFGGSQDTIYVKVYQISATVGRGYPLQATVSGPGFAYATFDPATAGASLTLSGGNLTVAKSGTADWNSVRTTVSKSAGKWYWEFAIDSGSIADGDSGRHMHGIGDTSVIGSNHVGSASGGYAYFEPSGDKFNNGSSAAFGSSYAPGDVIMVAVDAGAKKVWFGKNGTWQASGDPEAGTAPAFTYSPATVFAAVSLFWSGTNTTTAQVTGRFNPADFSYSAPSGFNAGLYS